MTMTMPITVDLKPLPVVTIGGTVHHLTEAEARSLQLSLANALAQLDAEDDCFCEDCHQLIDSAEAGCPCQSTDLCAECGGDMTEAEKLRGLCYDCHADWQNRD